MAAPATNFTAALGALANVQRTHATHASALGALERAFDAEMVRNRRLSSVMPKTGRLSPGFPNLQPYMHL